MSQILQATTPLKRLLSLDVMRGLTIAFMIMVNNNGGGNAWTQMEHSDWNGITATDVVFPTFLFLVGISIVFAFEARLSRGATRAKLAWTCVRRSLILFLLGVVVNGFPEFHLEHLRFYGVLQRIAICYLVVGLLYLWDKRASSKVAVIVAALVGYWVLVRWVPVPGAGMPVRDFPFLDKDLNIVAWVDRHLMPGHLYEDWPLGNMRDPEGLLSTIPAIATTLIGLLAGLWLRGQKSMADKTKGLLAGAAVCMILGYAWSLEFPLNKKMWTSSYVLVAAAWSLLLMALAFWAIEQKGWGKTGWSKALLWPWLVFGCNAITAYMISETLLPLLFDIRLPWAGHRVGLMGVMRRHLFVHIADPGLSAFTFSLMMTLICFVPMWVLYKRRIFVKV